MAGIKPWIGVDLDGTLAEHHSWYGIHTIGPMIKPMQSLIEDWLDEGQCDVKIFTARIAGIQYTPYKLKVISNIQDWLESNGLPRLEVTNVKDQYMVELYDDRAVQVEFNTGVTYGESTLKYRRLLKQS